MKLLTGVALLFVTLASVGYAFESWAGGVAVQQQLATEEGLRQYALQLILDNWWCAFGGLGGMLYGYYRINFVNRERKNWQWIFRMEVAGVAAGFTALLMTAFVDAELYPKAVAIVCFAPITGMGTPVFYDAVWRPFLWPLLKGIARAVAKRFVKTVEATGTQLDDDSTIVKFAKGGTKDDATSDN